MGLPWSEVEPGWCIVLSIVIMIALLAFSLGQADQVIFAAEKASATWFQSVPANALERVGGSRLVRTFDSPVRASDDRFEWGPGQGTQLGGFVLCSIPVTDPVTFTTRTVICDFHLNYQEILLTGLTADPERRPVGLALRWSVSKSWGGWFRSWKLQLVSQLGLLPAKYVSGREQGVEYCDLLENGAAKPVEGHVYESTLSYSPSTGFLSVLLKDVTAGKEVYSASLMIDGYARPLYPGAGWLAGGGQEGNKHKSVVITSEFVSVEPGYHQLGLPIDMKHGFAWYLGVMACGNLQRTVRKEFYQDETVGFRLEWPERQVPGKIVLQLSREQNQATIWEGEWSAQPVTISFPLEGLLGRPVFWLKYVDGEHVVTVGKEELQVIRNRIHAEYAIDSEVLVLPVQQEKVLAGGLRGRLILKADHPVEKLPVQLKAEYLPAGDEEEPVETNVLDTVVSLPGGESSSLPFVLNLPAGRGELGLKLVTGASGVVIEDGSVRFSVQTVDIPPDQLRVNSVKPAGTTTGLYQPVFIDIDLTADYRDPFNPEDIKVDILMTAPDGDQIVLPCFYLSGEPTDSRWQGRFTPRQTGQYAYQVKVTTRLGQTLSEQYTLQVERSSRDGFIRINPESMYTFLYDSGRLFRGIGANFGWEFNGGGRKFTYEYMLRELGANGANFIRTWMCPWNLPLEWKKWGIGRYDPEVAERLDEIIALAEKHGIYLMLVLDYHGVLQEKPDYWGANDEWKNNPYNVKNGGPCSSPAEFFTSEEARRFYKRRLRYLVARWGFSPHIAVWEFWNEIDHVVRQGVRESDVVDWHKEMADYLRQIDPYDHLVSTSISHQNLRGLWEIEGLHFSQHHLYGQTEDLPKLLTRLVHRNKKPHIIGEFAFDWRSPDQVGVPEAYERELHLGLWRGVFSETPVLPLTWWWDHHAARDEFFHLCPVRDFVEKMLSTGVSDFIPLNLKTKQDLEAMGLAAGEDRFIWLRNRGRVSIESSLVQVPVDGPGSYAVRYYNPLTGQKSREEGVETDTEELEVRFVDLAEDQDVALWVSKVK